MTDQEPTQRVFAYSTDDEKLYAYNFTATQLEEAVSTFTLDIFFMMTDNEAEEFAAIKPVDNLKNDFIWFRPGVNKLSIMECTCGNFLETADPTDAGHDKLARRALKHARKTGHQLNPRGN